MEYRKLGRSGMYVSEIAYGNWLTHGSQIGDDTAAQCVHAALDAGVSTFDTADAYAETRAEAALGQALSGVRRESVEILTKVYFPTGPGKNDRGLSRKHILEAIHGSLRRLKTDYIDLYQAHRFDYETPLEETMQAFADVVRAGKALYIGVSEWTVDEIRSAAVLAKELKIELVANQPQYNMLWRVVEPEIIPASEELGISQIVWSPLAQGVLTGKYSPGKGAPAGSRATDQNGGRDTVAKWLGDDVLTRVQRLLPLAASMGIPLGTLALGASKPERIYRYRRSLQTTADQGKCKGRRAHARGRPHEADRRNPRARHRTGPAQGRQLPQQALRTISGGSNCRLPPPNTQRIGPTCL